MKKILKRLMTLAIAGVLFLGNVAALNVFTSKADEAPTPIPIDMYLIGGQSNAAGYTYHKDELNDEFENVLYGGEADRSIHYENSTPAYLTYEDFVPVRAGLGQSSPYVGPEYGIAEAINENYSGEKKAFIFKTAAGGTSLRDITTPLDHSSGLFGNWYPRSLWPEGYTPNVKEQFTGNDPTGNLYLRFVENFRIVYNELIDNGYAPTVKGMAWMQGCADLGCHDAYVDLLKTLITDIRADLVEITGDETLVEMPFVIGEIANVGIWNNPDVPKMNEAQRKVAAEMDDSVQTIPTSDFKIVNEDGTFNNARGDGYHFNVGDMQKLGIRFGEKLLELNEMDYVMTSAKMGKISYERLENNSVQFSLIPNKNYKISSFKVNGEEKASQLLNGVFVLENATGRTTAIAEFVLKDSYKLTYSYNDKVVGLFDAPLKVWENDTIEMKLATKKGYVIESVTIGGVAATYNAEKGVYVADAVNKDSEVVIKCKSTGNSGDEGVEDSNESSGCSGTVATVAAIPLVVGIAAVMALRGKRKNEK